jgi:hypothetical protein
MNISNHTHIFTMKRIRYDHKGGSYSAAADGRDDYTSTEDGDGDFYPEGPLGDEMRELERRFLTREDCATKKKRCFPKRSAIITEQPQNDKKKAPSLNPTARNNDDCDACFVLSDSEQCVQDDGRLALHHPRQDRHNIDTRELQYHETLSLGGRLKRYNRSWPRCTDLVDRRPDPRNEPSLHEHDGNISPSVSARMLETTGLYVIPMACPTDAAKVTRYQCLIRCSLEYFTATLDDISTKVQGRRDRILPNQLGIRCKYCSHLPTSLRAPSASVYPKTLINLYQGAQYIASAHMMKRCVCAPKQLVQEMTLEHRRQTASKSGRPYWSEMCRNAGIYEQDGALWLAPPAAMAQRRVDETLFCEVQSRVSVCEKSALLDIPVEWERTAHSPHESDDV